jgi:TatD DNase family protein
LYIDAHFHCDIYTRYENALERALELLERHGILVVSSSTEPESYKQTLDIAEKSRHVLPCFGVHPQVAHKYLGRLDSLDELFNGAVAYGEIGLDHLHLKDESQYPAQYTVLKSFLGKARDQDKLVILHLDGAEEEGLELIRQFSLRRVIVHGYKGSLDTMKELLDSGCYFSVGGNMIMEKFKAHIPSDEWERSHAAVKKLPSDRLLVETDGPCRIEPSSPPGAPRRMPTYLFDVIAEIAEIRELAPEELVRSTNQNFKQLIEDNEHLIPYYNLI